MGAATFRSFPVHHLAGHIESLTLAHGELPLPAAVLVVSGGHTSLYLVPEPGVYRLIGRTRDDAAGEAYDKVAKLLGLGYPGGPVIDRLARQAGRSRFRFPVTRLTHADRNAPRATATGLLPADVARRTDFSFAGLKTAVLRLVQERTTQASSASGDGTRCRTEDVADICASFQRVVVDALLERTFEAAQWLGRAQRRHRRRRVGQQPASRRRRGPRRASGLPVFVPPIALSTDNAAMIGAAGLRRYRARHRSRRWDLNAEASLPLSHEDFTDYLWFNTKQRQEFVRITDEVVGDRARRAASTMGWCWCRRCTSRPAST